MHGALPVRWACLIALLVGLGCGGHAGSSASSACSSSVPAPDVGPGAHGEYQVSLSTAPLLLSGPPIVAASGTSEVAYFDGKDLVERRLIPPLERRVRLQGTLQAEVGGGRVAVTLPEADRRLEVAVVDLAACDVHLTGVASVIGPTPSSSVHVDALAFAGDLMAYSSYDCMGGASWCYPHSDRIEAIDTRSGASVLVEGRMSDGYASLAIAGDLIAWAELQGPSYSTRQLAWRRIGSAGGGVIPGDAAGIVIDGERIAWSNGHVQVLDAASGQVAQATTDASRQQNPSLRGRLLAYEDDRNGDLDIFAIDLSSGTESPVFVGPGDQHLLGVMPDGIAWWSESASGVQLFWNPSFRP